MIDDEHSTNDSGPGDDSSREEFYYDLPGSEGRPRPEPDQAPPGAEKSDPPGEPKLGNGYDLGTWVVDGWHVIRDELVGYAIAALILIVITLVAWRIHPIVYIAVGGPLKAGLFLMTINHMRTGKPPIIGDLFQPYNRFVPVTLAFLLMSAFMAIGFVLCILPGIIVMGIYLFTFLFIVDKGYDFWEAMEASRRVASRDYMLFFLFALVLLVLNFAGILCFGIGLLITLPLQYAAIASAYRQIVGFAPEPAVRPYEPRPRHYPGSTGGEDPDYPDIVS
jgi:hypothetical protein